jgi:hypothetical protein
LAKLEEKFKKSWLNLGIYKLLLATEYNIRPNIPLWGAAFFSWSKSSNVFVCMIATNLLDPKIWNPHGLEVETDDWYWKGGLKIWNPVKHIMPIWELRWRIPWISKWEHETCHVFCSWDLETSKHFFIQCNFFFKHLDENFELMLYSLLFTEHTRFTISAVTWYGAR